MSCIYNKGAPLFVIVPVWVNVVKVLVKVPPVKSVPALPEFWIIKLAEDVVVNVAVFKPFWNNVAIFCSFVVGIFNTVPGRASI